MTTNLIPLATAATMTAFCRAQENNILAPAKQNQGLIPTCESFNRSAFDTLLSISGCIGIRVYSAMDSDQKIRFVICGINGSNEDVYIPVTSGGQEPILNVIENGIRCPEYCPPASPLNS